jgi:hypothetical protein
VPDESFGRARIGGVEEDATRGVNLLGFGVADVMSRHASAASTIFSVYAALNLRREARSGTTAAEATPPAVCLRSPSVPSGTPPAKPCCSSFPAENCDTTHVRSRPQAQ